MRSRRPVFGSAGIREPSCPFGRAMASQYVGVAGLSDGDELRLTASASATDVRAVASSCDLGINLHIDEAIRGYLT